MLRTAAARGFAPVFFLGFLGLAVFRVSAGAGLHELGAWLLVAIALSFAFERWIPYRRAFNRPRGDRRRDVLHAFVNEAANGLAVLSLPALGSVIPGSSGWPHGWPLAAQLVLAIVVADCGITLAHFASHRVEALWRFHAVHHSVERMYGLNGLMKHPVHQAFELACGTAPLVGWGMPLDVASLLAFAVAIQLLLQHSNVDLRIGPLARLWAVAPVHRYHHLNTTPEGDVNFGLFTTVWDRWLGTYRAEDGRAFGPGDLGVEGRPDYPVGYLAQLAAPFREISPR